MTREENSVTSAYCGGCGAAIEHSAKFCRSCGTDQAGVVPPTIPASAPSATRDPIASSPTGPGRGSVLTSPWRTAAGHRRSAVWIYYALIAAGCLILSFQHPASLLVALIAGLYSSYLFRGGSFVIWFW
jgi:hypothetical protein